MFTGSFYSKSLGMTTGLTVIFPDESNDVTPLFAGKPKLLYLLHGLSGSSAEWVRFSKIEYYAKKFHFSTLTMCVFIKKRKLWALRTLIGKLPAITNGLTGIRRSNMYFTFSVVWIPIPYRFIRKDVDNEI